MKKILLAIFILIFIHATSYADYYQSSFGFTSQLSKNWLVLTKEQVKKNPELFNFDNKALRGINKSMLAQVKNNILSGRTEIMYSTKSTGGFGDNINVMVTMGKVVNKSQVNQLCSQMPQAFKRMFGKSIKFYECGLRKIGNMKVLYMNFDGVMPGTRSAQYQFQTEPGKLVIATLTCKNSSYAKLNKEFNNFIRNVKRNQ